MMWHCSHIISHHALQLQAWCGAQEDGDADSEHSESTSWHEDSLERRSRQGRPEPSGPSAPYMNGHGPSTGPHADGHQPLHPRSHSYSRPRPREHDAGRGRGRGMPPPRRHLGPGVGPQAGHPTISRSSSSLSDRSAVADGRREPPPTPAATPAPAVQQQQQQQQQQQPQRASSQQAPPPQQEQPGPAPQPQPPAPTAVAAALQSAPLPPVKVEAAPKAAGVASQQPLPSPAALSSQPAAPITLPALPRAAEAPPAPATPAVRREPEHSSSTAKPLVEPLCLGSSGPLLQFGDVPIIMSEVQAPSR